MAFLFCIKKEISTSLTTINNRGGYDDNTEKH